MNYSKKQIQAIRDNCKVYEAIGNDEMMERYEDCLNDTETSVFGLSPADILREMDPIGYRCGLADFESALLSDGIISKDNAIEIEGEWYSDYDAGKYL